MDYLATNEFAGTGSIMQVEVHFAGLNPSEPSNPAPYLEIADVLAEIVTPAAAGQVEVAVPTALVSVNALTFRTVEVVPVDKVLRVYRNTELGYPLVDFVNLQVVSERDLDTLSRQALYTIQEARDLAQRAVADVVKAADSSRNLRVPVSDPEVATLPPVGSRVGRLLSFDGNGNPIAVAAESGSATELALNLANPLLGSGMVGYNPAVNYPTGTVGAALNFTKNGGALLQSYGAVGDGVADDTAAFTLLEATVTGKTIDLGHRTYSVSARPQKNTYVNGTFKYAGALRPATLMTGFAVPVGRFRHYGGQLAKLKTSLTNPFEQFTGVAFLGDSITWGATLPENLSPGSDLSTLATRRDVFASPSFVNEIKRYLGKEYFDNAAPVISNWPASSAGESTATYTKNVLVYINRAPFVTTIVGSSATVTDTGTIPQSVTGYHAVLAAGGGSTGLVVTMPAFTGEEFSVVFTAVASDAGSYEVIVGGVAGPSGVTGGTSLGTFSTVPNGSTIIDGSYGNRLRHTFSYVRNTAVHLVFTGVGHPTIRRLRVEAFEIPKTLRVTNQGISGSNSTRYRTRALTTSQLPDIAITPKDNYAVVQLGTNDRGPDSSWPNGLNSFSRQMEDIGDILDPLCDTIIMASCPAGPTNQVGKIFTMNQIRGALQQVAVKRNYDFVDHHAVFNWADTTAVLADALHPNALGHQMIYRNFVEALESA